MKKLLHTSVEKVFPAFCRNSWKVLIVENLLMNTYIRRKRNLTKNKVLFALVGEIVLLKKLFSLNHIFGSGTPRFVILFNEKVLRKVLLQFENLLRPSTVVVFHEANKKLFHMPRRTWGKQGEREKKVLSFLSLTLMCK